MLHIKHLSPPHHYHINIYDNLQSILAYIVFVFFRVQEVWHLPKHIFECLQCWEEQIAARVHISHMEILFSFFFLPPLFLFYLYLFIYFLNSSELNERHKLYMWFMGYIESSFKVMECLSKPYVSDHHHPPPHTHPKHFINSKLAFLILYFPFAPHCKMLLCAWGSSLFWGFHENRIVQKKLKSIL